MKVIDMHCDTIGEIYRRRCSGEEIGLASSPLQIDLEKLKAGNCNGKSRIYDLGNRRCIL